MSVNDFLLDFAVASVFIMIGQFLRAKVGFIQRFFIPASMLAGFMGLAFRYVFPGFLPMSDSIGSYPGMLIMVIFAAVGINGFTMNKGGSKGDVARMSSYLSYKMVAQVIQYGLVPAFSILVISNLWPEINYGFGLLLAAGFSGGHGTAAAVGSSFATLAFRTPWTLARPVPLWGSSPESSAECSSSSWGQKRAGPSTSRTFPISPVS
jgi:Na+/glutamate symporter